MNTLETILVNVDRLSLSIHDIPTPFGNLTSMQRRELIQLRMQGRTIEVWLSSVDGWREVDYPLWIATNCYRLKWNETELQAALIEDELLSLALVTSRKQEELDKLLKD